MVKPKNEKSMRDFLAEELERFEARNPVIATRWYVVEVTPSVDYWHDDGHGGAEKGWLEPIIKRVSEFMDTQKEATDWLLDHEPDEGSTLEVRFQHKRRTITERWW